VLLFPQQRVVLLTSLVIYLNICTELPLEPSLSRTLIEANELGCLSQALTVAAVLSAEITLRSSRRWPSPPRFPSLSYLHLCDGLVLTYRKDMEGKRKRQELPDGCGWGDHIQLLQIFECWDRTDYDPKWCLDHDLQVNWKEHYSSIVVCLMTNN
jgi:ATP-dependent RNA helicase DHX8/PRP22